MGCLNWPKFQLTSRFSTEETHQRAQTKTIFSDPDAFTPPPSPLRFLALPGNFPRAATGTSHVTRDRPTLQNGLNRSSHCCVRQLLYLTPS